MKMPMEEEMKELSDHALQGWIECLADSLWEAHNTAPELGGIPALTEALEQAQRESLRRRLDLTPRGA